jgi:hypothetical protein
MSRVLRNALFYCFENLIQIKTKFLAIFILVGFPGASMAVGYTASTVEIAVLDAVMQDDIRALSEGQANYATTALNIATSTVSDVAKSYAKNKEDADRKFHKKRLVLSGVVASVRENRGGQAVILFSDTGSIQVRAHTSENVLSRTSPFNPGTHISLVCTGSSGNATIVVFSECESGDIFGRQAWENIKADLYGFYQGKPAKNVSIPMLAINIALFASQLQSDHGCSKNIEKCRTSFMAVGSLNGRDDLLGEIVLRFKEAGLDLSLFATIPATP